jgi:SAM-dependent methyltransferase
VRKLIAQGVDVKFLNDMRVRLQRFVLDTRQAHRRGGLREAVPLATQLIYRQVHRPVAFAREYNFDRRHGLDTRGWRVVDAEAVAGSQHRDGTDFEPIPVWELHRVLEALPSVDPSEFTFIDLGCGKGGTLAVAALRGFRRVVGVEFDSQLAAAARTNARVMGARTGTEIEVIEGDVSTYRFPAEPTVVYLFNPFGAGTMGSVAASLAASLQEWPRPVFVLYVHPLHRQIWDELPTLTPIRSNRRWVLYSATAPLYGEGETKVSSSGG